MVTAYLVFLALLAGERLVELRLSARNRAWTLARGGIEVGQGQLRWMKMLHTAFPLGCAAEVLLMRRPFVAPLAGFMLSLCVAAQLLRYWTVHTLGRSWNIHVVVVPGSPVVDRGPFRYLRHPNYLAVVIEGLAVPLIHSAWITAAVFTVLNALLLTARIRCEERALSEHCDYAQRLGARNRLIPRRRVAGGVR
ncbi:MAG: hypothetical protein IPG96_13650 [Proteobacteria bacterium]|nr:hypothetical protein [Pseudomonadota bacterium]